MVASTHWLATGVGMAVLERGGNAFDAAVAAGLTQQVVEPDECGPGGEMSAILYDSRRDRVAVVCGQGPAPAAATIGRFRALGLDMVPGNGLLAACVPGAVGGWLLLLRDFGTWRLRDVLEFAIDYAASGFPVIPRTTAVIAGAGPLFRTHWPDSARLWLQHDRAPTPASRFRNPALAATYSRLLREAEAGGGRREAQIEAAMRSWYEGFVADAIDRFLGHAQALDATGLPHAGLLRGQDMASWRPVVDEPVALDYLGWRVYKAGVWSQGPVLLQQLALLRGFDLGAMGTGSADFVHTIVECAKLAYADREAWYGDAAVGRDILPSLLGAAYNDERRRLVGQAASTELRPGDVNGRRARLPSPGGGSSGTAAGARRPARPGAARGDTCHLDVVDRWGNMVAVTPSGGWLQGSPAIPELGFALGTRAQMFNLDPLHPNALAPGKRPRTTISPSLALCDGSPGLVFGTPGADEQDQWALIFFLYLVHTDWSLQQAIDAPVFHTNHFPRSEYPHIVRPGLVEVDAAIDADAIAELRRRGHTVRVRHARPLSGLSAAGRDPETAWLRAAAHSRTAQGFACGR